MTAEFIDVRCEHCSFDVDDDITTDTGKEWQHMSFCYLTKSAFAAVSGYSRSYFAGDGDTQARLVDAVREDEDRETGVLNLTPRS